MRPNDQRAKRLVLFLWINLAVLAVSTISDFMEYLLFNRIRSGNFDMSEVTGNDLRQLLIGVVLAAIGITVMVLFIQWFRRAYFNLHTFSKELSFSEGWAAGAWFIPFMNLVRPYRIMKEMMFVSEKTLLSAKRIPEKNFRAQSVGIWWTLWIIVSILSNINTRIAIQANDLEVIIGNSLFGIIVNLLYIPLTIFTVKMIKEYAQLEELLPLVVTQEKEFKINNSDLLDS